MPGLWTREIHAERHRRLHTSLDELVADFITHTDRRPSQTTVMELMEWAYAQTKEPTGDDHEDRPANVGDPS